MKIPKTIWLLGLFAYERVSTLIIAGIITNNLSQVEAGEIFQIFLYTSIFTVIANHGARGAVVKYTISYISAGETNKYFGLLRTTILTSLIISAFSFITIYILAELFHNHNSYATLAVLVIPMSFLLLIQQHLRGLKKVVTPFISEKLILPSIVIMAMLWHLYYGELGTEKIFWIYLFSYLIACITIAKILIVELSDIKKNSNNKGVIYEFDKWKKSFTPVWGASIFQILTSRIDQIIIVSLLTTSSFASYIVVAKIALSVALVENVIRSRTIAELAEYHQDQDLEKIRSVVQRKSFQSLGIVLLILIFFYMFGEEVLLLFGEDYVQNIGILYILLTSQFIQIFFMFTNTFGLITNIENLYLKWNIMNLVLAITLIPLMTFLYEMYGVAYGMLIVNLIMGIIKTRDIRKHTGIKSTIFY